MSLNEHPQFCTRGLVYYTTRRLKDDILLQRSQQAWKEAKRQRREMLEKSGLLELEAENDPLAWCTTQQYDRLTREYLAKKMGLENETRNQSNKKDEQLRLWSAKKAREILRVPSDHVDSASDLFGNNSVQPTRLRKNELSVSVTGCRRPQSARTKSDFSKQHKEVSSPMSIDGDTRAERHWRRRRSASEAPAEGAQNQAPSARHRVSSLSEISSLSTVRKIASEAPISVVSTRASSKRRPQSARLGRSTHHVGVPPQQTNVYNSSIRNRRPQSATQHVTTTRNATPINKVKSRVVYQKMQNAWSPPQPATSNKVFEQLRRYQEMYAPPTTPKRRSSAVRV
mmetsp:Transcript_3868/g.14623  ORF Transcript_3868/g.14623 Transcript_3868/m.14623 type:complete len:341 (-) Transcript_3868:127-1149(-)|eukprot:CAMPEP_0117442168 /NCGR_PEP_ID=MMETSP0759-20121206/4011_1 /TAXON_ID=63605 /ORGANISM="Percolomonas cosmopolitus, Strain WS" /LENGTH=340 /DNA_ID=CAMNT_0005234045 /DNA_START=59 /DNA_END=1081 /DNA_ORIENTATION=-